MLTVVARLTVDTIEHVNCQRLHTRREQHGERKRSRGSHTQTRKYIKKEAQKYEKTFLELKLCATLGGAM